MQAVLLDVLLAQVLEGSCTNVQRHVGMAHPHGARLLQHGTIEMQPGRGCGDRPGPAGVNGLVAVLVFHLRLALEIRRQRHVAVYIEVRQNLVRELDRKQVPVTPRDFCLGTTFEQQPSPRFGRLARADMGQCGPRRLHAFDQDLGFAAGFLARHEARLDHARVVEDQQVPLTEQGWQMGEPEIPDAVVNDEQAAVAALPGRVARNQLLRQRIIEVGYQHGRA